MVAQDAEHAEIGREDGQAQHPGDERCQHAEEGADHAGADGDYPGDEGNAARDRVQDHCSSEACGGSGFDFVEFALTGGGDDVCGCVANVSAGAPVWRVSVAESVLCSW